VAITIGNPDFTGAGWHEDDKRHKAITLLETNNLKDFINYFQ
jgi:hypothetical protein